MAQHYEFSFTPGRLLNTVKIVRSQYVHVSTKDSVFHKIFTISDFPDKIPTYQRLDFIDTNTVNPQFYDVYVYVQILLTQT